MADLDFSAGGLIAEARRRAGFSDFGDDEFVPRFEALLDSLKRQTVLTAEGATKAHERFLRLLANRLRFQADLQKHPEILDQTLLPPVIIVGLPRTGSTKLMRMLSVSKSFQELIFWQGYNPARVLDQEDSGRAQRISAARDYVQWRAGTNPATNAGHFIDVMEPEEESFLLEFTFGSYYPYAFFDIPDFVHWVRTQNDDKPYLYLRQLLQYIQWQFHRVAPLPWILKSPPNLGHEAALAKHFPGIRFLMTHRDPVTVVPSTAAIARESHKLYCDGVPDYRAISDLMLDELAQGMNRNLAWRDTKPKNAILDLSYNDIQDREMDVVKQVYDFLGLTLSAEQTAAMRGWLVDNTQHKHGKHDYSLTESGLTEDRINTAFAGYRSRFKHLF